jgi:hypothetical protein
MWPDLSSFGAEIAQITNRDGTPVGLHLSGFLTDDQMMALLQSGFVLTGKSGRQNEVGIDEMAFRSDLPGFKLSQLRQWFPAFDVKTMIMPEPIRIADEEVQKLHATDVAVSAQSADEGVDEEGDEDDEESDEFDPSDKEVFGPSVAAEEKFRKITDSGEKIGRARKDLYSGKKLVYNDFFDMSEKDRDENLSKTKIWPFSLRACFENGVSPQVARYVRDLRKIFPPHYKIVGSTHYTTEKGLVIEISEAEYVNFLAGLRDALEPVKTVADLGVAMIGFISQESVLDFFDKAFALYFPKKIDGISYPKKSSKAFDVMASKLSRFSYSYRGDYKRTGRTVIDSFDPFDLFPIVGTIKEPGTQGWNDAWESLGIKVRADASEEKTEEVAEADDEEVEQKKKKPARPHLDHLENAWKTGEVIYPEDLMSRFGFRAVEFGEWLPQDERRLVLAEAYAACIALAEATGVPEKMISMNGTLAAAFGSRGHGRSVAHYEPDLKVFNLTRMKGAGSMAHEWGHALHDYIEGGFSNISDPNMIAFLKRVKSEGRITRGKLIPIVESEVNLLIDYARSWLKPFSSDTHEIGNYYANAAIVARSALKHLGVPENERTAKNLDLLLTKKCGYKDVKHERMRFYGDKKYGHCIRTVYLDRDIQVGKMTMECLEKGLADAILDDVFAFFPEVEKSKIMPEMEKRNFSANIARLERAIDSIYKRDNGMGCLFERMPDRVSTFMQNAQMLDAKRSKPYWSTNHEMFARAFESFVFDRLHEHGMPCDFLVHSVGETLFESDAFAGNPYPAGEERKDLNGIIGNLCLDFANKHRNIQNDSEGAKLRPKAASA